MMQKYLSKRLKGRSGGRVQSALFNLELKSHIYIPARRPYLAYVAHDGAKKCQMWPTCVACTRDPRKRVSWEKNTAWPTWPAWPCDLCTIVTDVFEVARVTYVTQFCVSVTYSLLGHKRDPILWPCDSCFRWKNTTWPRDPCDPAP